MMSYKEFLRARIVTAAVAATLVAVPAMGQPATGGSEDDKTGSYQVNCKNLAIDNLVQAVNTGTIQVNSIIQGCRSNLSNLPSGSGNIPVVLEAALIYGGAQTPDTMYPLLTGQNGWRSHNGREGQSWIYEAWNVTAVLAVLRWAQTHGDTTTIEHCRTWLRAEWTKLALGSIRIPRHMVLWTHDQEVGADRLNVKYDGLWSGVAGERMVLINQGTGAGSRAMEASILGPLLSWALDYQPRKWNTTINTNPDQWSWMLWVVNRLHNITYATDPGPDAFGLTAVERARLRALVNNPTAANAQRVLAYLGPFRPVNGRGLIYRRYTNGRMLNVLQHAINGNKPGVPVVFADANANGGEGVATAYSPSSPVGVGAPSALGEIDDAAGIAIATSLESPSVRNEQVLPPLSALLWEVAWLSSGVRFTAGGPNCLLTEGDADYCLLCGPCDEGEADCDDDAECVGDLVCQFNGGVDGDTCIDPNAPPPICPDLGDPTYCTVCGPCDVGEGDCDGDVQCAPGLVCMNNVGPNYGFTAPTDVCEAPAVACNWPEGHGHYCRDCGPCGVGQGDCDSADQCVGALQCSDNVGAAYGFPPAVDVCEVSGSGATASIAVLELLPSDDSFIAQDQPNQVFDTGELRVRWSGVGNGRYSFLRFDLPPINGTILSVKLKLQTQETVIGEAGFYRVLGLTWSEDTFTWASFESQVASGTATYPWLGSLTNLAANTSHSFDVTDQINGPGPYTFGIASGVDVPNQDFWSREGGVEPVLEIRYLP